MTIQDVRRNYYEGKYRPKVDLLKEHSYPIGYIFDEDKSVRWNKEEVDRRNKERRKAYEEYRLQATSLDNKMKEDICQALEQEYNIPVTGGRLIERYIHNKTDMIEDYFNGIEELSDLIENIIKDM